MLVGWKFSRPFYNIDEQEDEYNDFRVSEFEILILATNLDPRLSASWAGNWTAPLHFAFISEDAPMHPYFRGRTTNSCLFKSMRYFASTGRTTSCLFHKATTLNLFHRADKSISVQRTDHFVFVPEDEQGGQILESSHPI